MASPLRKRMLCPRRQSLWDGDKHNSAGGEDVPRRKCVGYCVWFRNYKPSFVTRRTVTIWAAARWTVCVRVTPPGGAVGSEMRGRSRGTGPCNPCPSLTQGGVGGPRTVAIHIATRACSRPLFEEQETSTILRLCRLCPSVPPAQAGRVARPGASPQEEGERKLVRGRG